MTPALESPSSYVNQTPTGSRLASAAAALILTALFVWLLIRLGLVATLPPPPGTALVTINLPPGQKQAEATKAPAKSQSTSHRSQQSVTKPSAVPPPIVPPPPVAAKNTPWNVIWMSHDDMAAADISHMQGHHDEHAAAESAGDASADAGGGAAGAGGPPGPDHLFDADWYRRPTHAEMATYMPKDLTEPGYGMVACKTAPDYRVEDCRELDETPGSHLSRAVREAAWQFRVMPPRINGRPMIGAWVRIRFDVSLTGDADAAN